MTPAAIILMVITILIIWGGLIASIVAFREGSKRTKKADLKATSIPADRKGGI